MRLFDPSDLEFGSLPMYLRIYNSDAQVISRFFTNWFQI